MDPFDGNRLQPLATDYISNAGACHRISLTLLRGIVLKAKYSGNVAASAVIKPVAAVAVWYKLYRPVMQILSS